MGTVERGVVCFGTLLFKPNKKKRVTKSDLFYGNEKRVSFCLLSAQM